MRHANIFHRARKHHRKFRNALYSGRIWYIEHHGDLCDKYFDMFNTRSNTHTIVHRGIADACVLVLKSKTEAL